jgi:hypothetical protein
MDSDFIFSLFNQQGNARPQLGGKCLPLEKSDQLTGDGKWPKEKQRLQTQFRVQVAFLKEEPG